MPFQKLPPPTWSGVAPGAKDGFIAHCRTLTHASTHRELRNVQSQLSDNESELRHYSQAIRDARANLKRWNEEREASKAQLVDNTTDEQIEQMLANMQQLPGFLGMRVDEHGRLVVALRAIAEYDGALRDIGDYEISFGRPVRDVFNYKLIRRTVAHNDLLCIELVQVRGNVGYASRTRFGSIVNDKLVQLKNAGLLYEYLLLFGTSIAEKSRDYQTYFPQLTAEDPDPEIVWSGTMVSAAVLRNAVKELQHSDLITRIERLERDIGESEKSVASWGEYCKGYTSTIANCKAAIRDLEARITDSDRLVSDQQAEEMFRHILSLPGVMGLRIKADGVPEVHVRTTLAYDGHRYDLGDFNVTLGLKTGRRYESGDLVPIEMTRAPHPDRARYGSMAHLYFSPKGDRLTADHPMVGWFCFGHRKSELERILSSGLLGAFLHLAINSMNQVNNPSEMRYSSDYYAEIELNDVWKRKRLRPRRVTRAVHEQRVADALRQAEERNRPTGRFRRLARHLGQTAVADQVA